MVAIALYGCTGMRPAVPPGDGMPTPGLSAPKSISARAVVELEDDTRVRGRAQIAVESPDRFRIEVYGPVGQVAATLVSDGKHLLVYSRGQRRVYRWDDPFLPYSFTATDVVGVLTGSFPATAPGYDTTTDSEGHVTSALRATAESWSGRGGRGKWAAGDRAGQIRLGMADYRDAGGAVVPFTMTIDDGSRSLRIEYTEVQTPSTHPPETFSTTPLDGK